ncbi:hybrid sensor histidine kinase/response regulator [Flavobacterium weaverense]|uniref:histidine kinase n=1 Tax=Flavobacterium weaverense TaxID=271156 RepID=A0A3L9ZU93_9FLAO|nr:hybrid sensor histidine kinase/response regulator [Flavobacterium weaverense]RMA76273.1 signal transduction histidine kinase [Flavobacterium weaverense]
MNQKRRKQISSVLKLLFFILFYSNTYSQYVFNSDAVPDRISLHNHTTMVNVANRDLNINYVISNFNSLNPSKLKTENDDLGFTQNNFWLKTVLRNNTNNKLSYYLETARPLTDLVELYTIDETTVIITKRISGDLIPYSKRSFDNRKIIFKIEIAPQSSQQLFIHLRSDGEAIKIPMILYSSESFIKMIANEQLFFGVFYGILLLAAIVYFFFFLALSEKVFLYYSLYVFFMGLLQFALDGFFFKFVTPNGGWLSNHAVLFIAIVAVFLSGKYSELFLKIKDNSKKIYTLFNVAYVLLFTLLLITILFPSLLLASYIFVNVLTLIFLLLIIFSIGHLYYTKKSIDPFFTTGISFLIIGFAVFILYNFGILPDNFFTKYSAKIGTGLEVIFLSLSMSNLIRNLKNEKNELNRLALIRSEEMNDLKSYFLSNISHELRTPLNAIMNLIDSISTEVEDEKIHKKCQIIKYSSNSLLSSVNDILDFSKIEKDELKLEVMPFDFSKVLENLNFNASNIAAEKGLSFEFSKSNSVPNFLIGDEARLTQIINNVLNNAIKFTSEGGVKFTVDSAIKSQNRASLKFTVVDSGIGIPKNKIDSIFDSFSQNNIDNKRKFGGLGLGLYIVKTLVDMQNGTIKMTSEINKGTTFEIMLDFDVEVKEEVVIVEQVPIACDLKGKSILVVEDNPINQMVIKMITKKWLNTEVAYANNGEEAIDLLKKSHFDIILMDLQMPVMDGYEATIAIRNGQAGVKNTNIPIIAITADVMEGTKQRVSEIGMNDYLSKPVKKEILYESILKLV